MYDIYLAGPIAGLTFDACTVWRQQFIREVGFFSLPFRGVSPLRGKDALKKEGVLSHGGYNFPGMSSREIFARDKHDVSTCDAVLVNLSGHSRSVGTLIELGMANALCKPIFAITDKEDPGMVDHVFLREMVYSWSCSVRGGIDELSTFFL